MADVRWRVMIAWDGSNYIDETARLVQASGEHRFSPPEDLITGGKGIVDSMSIELTNQGNRYSPLNTASPLYSAIQNGQAYHAPIYFEVSVNGGTNYYRQFTGVIKIPQPSGPTAREISSVSIECRSRDELLLQKKLSTSQVDFRASSGYDESQLINLWLTQAGVSGADMVLSPGLYPIDYAWLDDESPLEEIWTLAAACGGRFYADMDGKYRYESATHWLTNSRSTGAQETLTEASYEQIKILYDDGDLYNEVTVESSARYVDTQDVLWEPDEVIFVPANSTKKLTARLRQPAWSIDTISYSAATSGGQDVTASVSVTSVINAQSVDLTITNAHATWGAYLRPLKVVGQALAGGPSHEETRDSATYGSNSAFFTTRGGRSKRVPGSVYVQSKAHAGAVAEFLLRRYEVPRLSYTMSGAIGVPTRKLGDRITINDSMIGDSSRDALLIGIRWQVGLADGFTQDLEAIDAGQLYPSHPSPGYFRVDTDSLGGTRVLFF